MARRNLGIRKAPRTGNYPTISGFHPHRIVQSEPMDPVIPNVPDWSIKNKKIRIVTTVIVFLFAGLIIGSVFF